MLAAGGCKCLIRSLDDSLRPDVDPASCRHLAIHRQVQRFKTIEFVARRPMGNHIGVCDENPRRMGECPKGSDRLSRLNQKRLVAFQAFPQPPRRGCSSASAWQLPVASLYTKSMFRAERGQGRTQTSCDSLMNPPSLMIDRKSVV